MDRRKNRVFVTERRDIEYPLWRKKADSSLFYDKAILIPKFAESMWEIPKEFAGINSKKNVKSKVIIWFEGNSFNGYVTNLNAIKRKNSFRIFFETDLSDLLKERFLMTYIRDLEFKLGDYDSDPENRASIENIIPFNEFLDIEYSSTTKEFFFTAHYTQQVTFKNLFNKILDSTVLKRIELEIANKKEIKIIKSNWLKKEELNKIPDQKNVLYTLFDEVNNQIYFGEAISLKKRLSTSRPEIPSWTHFKYSVLPPELEPYRIEIERMQIRDYASLFLNKKSIISKNVSNCKLMNTKIDK